MLFLNKQIYIHRRNGAKCTQRTKYYCIIVQSNKIIKWNCPCSTRTRTNEENWNAIMQNNTKEGGGTSNTKSASTQHSNQNETKYVERKQQ